MWHFLFITSSIDVYCRRIRDNEYEFPIERPVSSATRALIQAILAPDPSQRPTLHEIVDSTFFSQGPVPAFIPTSAHDAPPDFRHITRQASDTNLRRLRRAVLMDVEFGSPSVLQKQARDVAAKVNGHLKAQEDASAARIAQRDLAAASSKQRDPPRNMATSVAEQEKEFQKAVQPGSPISALLSSARQPLLVGPTSTGPGVRESPLMRKLQSAGGARESPLGRRSVTRNANGVIVEEDEDANDAPARRVPSGSRQNTLGRTTAPPGTSGTAAQRMMSRFEEEEAREERQRQKELEAQKARIVAQMAPVREEAEELSEQLDRLEEEDEGDEDEYVSSEEAPQEEEPPVKPPSSRDRESEERERRAKAQPRERAKDKENVVPSVASSSRAAPPPPQASSSRLPPAPSTKPTLDEALGGDVPPKLNSFDAAAQTLTMAFDARTAGKVFRSPIRREDVPEERVSVFIFL